MARIPKTPVAHVPPIMEPGTAIERINRQIDKADNLRELGWAAPERSQWTTTSEGLLKASFGDGDSIIDQFAIHHGFVTSSRDTEESLRRKANEQIEGFVSVLRSAKEQLEWKLPQDSQHFMASGSQHDAYVNLRNIVQTARSEIIIVDNYVDETLWTLLTNVPSTAKISVLTMQTQKDFALEAKKFVAQHKNTVEIRKRSQVHDRFIIIDGSTVWHLGPSIKDAGAKAALMSAIQGLIVKAAAIQEVTNLWNSATPLPI
jgi:hypothetical protein